MGLLERAKKSMELEKVTPPKPIRRIPKPKKLTIPNHIKILFDNLDKSISSVWGIQKNGSVKWDAKYNMWLSFKEYFKGLM